MHDPSLKLITSITIRVWSDESMTIEGPMADPEWIMLALDHAKDAVKAQLRRTPGSPNVVVPGKDTSLDGGPVLVKP